MNFPSEVIFQVVMCWKDLGKMSAFEILETKELIAFKSHIDSRALNYAFADNSASLQDISNVLNFFGKQAFFWHVDTGQKDLQEKLLQKGLQKKGNFIGMSLDLCSFHPKIDPNVLVKQVVDEKALQEWIEVVKKGFGFSYEIEKFVTPMFLNKRDVYSFYTAYVDGKPAAVSCCAVFAYTAAIYFVTTLQEHRRKGAGHMVSTYPLIEAKKRNCKKAVLQSSKMAEELYRKIGFKDSANFVEFTNQED